jgi:hypothetical protein
MVRYGSLDPLSPIEEANDIQATRPMRCAASLRTSDLSDVWSSVVVWGMLWDLSLSHHSQDSQSFFQYGRREKPTQEVRFPAFDSNFRLSGYKVQFLKLDVSIKFPIIIESYPWFTVYDLSFTSLVFLTSLRFTCRQRILCAYYQPHTKSQSHLDISHTITTKLQ